MLSRGTVGFVVLIAACSGTQTADAPAVAEVGTDAGECTVDPPPPWSCVDATHAQHYERIDDCHVFCGDVACSGAGGKLAAIEVCPTGSHCVPAGIGVFAPCVAVTSDAASDVAETVDANAKADAPDAVDVRD